MKEQAGCATHAPNPARSVPRPPLQAASRQGQHPAVRSVSSPTSSASADVDTSHITVIGQLDGLPETADIEDLFSTKDYLWLYNKATEVTVNEEELITPDKPLPILQRIGIAREKQRKPRDFDHVGPAHQLTRDKDDFFAQVDDDTLDRFEKVFKKLTA